MLLAVRATGGVRRAAGAESAPVLPRLWRLFAQPLVSTIADSVDGVAADQAADCLRELVRATRVAHAGSGLALAGLLLGRARGTAAALRVPADLLGTLAEALEPEELACTPSPRLAALVGDVLAHL